MYLLFFITLFIINYNNSIANALCCPFNADMIRVKLLQVISLIQNIIQMLDIIIWYYLCRCFYILNRDILLHQIAKLFKIGW